MRAKNTKKWIMALSIISVVFLITPSIGVAFEEDATSKIGEKPDDQLSEYLKLIIKGIEDENNDLDGDGRSSGDPNGDLSSKGNSLSSSSSNSGYDMEAVDVVIAADGNGIVDWPVEIETIPLNIIGHAEVNVISGDENLARKPVFAGLDFVDNIGLTIVALSIILVARIAQMLNEKFRMNLNIAAQVGKLVVAGLLTAFISALIAGSLPVFLAFFTGVGAGTLLYILEGYGLPDSLKSMILSICETVKQLFSGLYTQLVEWWNDFDLSTALNKILVIINDLAVPVAKIMVQKTYAAIIAITMVLNYFKNGPDWAAIKSELMKIGLSSSEAQQLIDTIQSHFESIRDFRDQTLGKLNIFFSRGKQNLNLNNLYLEIDDGYQVGDDGFVAKVEIKAISAGLEFDTKTIGIYFEGFTNPDDENPNSMQSTPSSTGSMPAQTETSTGMTSSQSSTMKSGSTGACSL